MSVYGLGPTIAINKISGAARKAAGLLSRALAGRIERWSHRLRAFTRYRVGAVTPAVGPLTLLIVARPRRTEVSG